MRPPRSEVCPICLGYIHVMQGLPPKGDIGPVGMLQHIAAMHPEAAGHPTPQQRYQERYLHDRRN